VPSDQPVFTIVIATFERGPLIAATLESVAAQTIADYEVLVVSDGPAADGLAETVERFGERFHLHQLETRGRSQSGPNNYGWDAARARYVVYLGHDDVWHPHHLERLADTFASHPAASFAVSGCIFFGPPGAARSATWVTGIFDSSDHDIPREQFFPPSSFGHWRDLPVDLSEWPNAETSREPVDVRFLRSAVAAGEQFASTGVVTVYKFASALRYLSYLSPDDWEQREMLARIARPSDLDSYIAVIVEQAKADGKFMVSRYANPTSDRGEVLRRNEQTRGISSSSLPTLGRGLWLPPGDDARAFDWYPGRAYEGNPVRWRWSGPNPHPRILVAVVSDRSVDYFVHIAAFDSARTAESLRVLVNQRPVHAQLTYAVDSDHFVLTFSAPLRPDRASVLELQMDDDLASDDQPSNPDDEPRSPGLCLLGIEVVPTSSPRPDTHRELLALAQRDLALALRDQTRAQRDQARADLRLISESRTWRYTSRLRELRHRLARNTVR
jgi:glycosyltransferase involved in cell wall biosynthesis